MKHYSMITPAGLTQMQQQNMEFRHLVSLVLYIQESPDLAPREFYLWHLKGQNFWCDEEVKSTVKKWFTTKH